MSTEIRELHGDDEVRAAWPVVRQLRPHLDADALVAAVRAQRSEGYRLVALFDAGVLRVAAGFRVEHMLHRGRSVYVDDLVTDESARGSGLGKVLFDWLVAEARRLDCREFHLDSGVQRFAAHAFYFGRRMHISAYHFVLPLTE